jgi:cation:H+ antiporter
LATEIASQRSWVWIITSAAIGMPAFILRLSGTEGLDPVFVAVVYGIGIVGGAFLLSWAAEAAQVDVSAALAIAALALIAVLPEYAIEAVLAWAAGSSYVPGTGEVTVEMQRAAANVTGANRLLIGLGWSMVILIFWLKSRRGIDLQGKLSLELGMLTVATAGVFLIFFMGQVHLIVGAALIGLYLFYLWKSSRQAVEEPELVGPSLLIGTLSTWRRRTTVVILFLYAASVILVAAEPFVDSLVETGLHLGIDEFILIQWIAPLASESPEIIIAVLFTLRANPVAGITILISSAVNQLTLLIGSIVMIFSVAAGEPLNFLLDNRQAVEFLLTAAVALFAILLIFPRRVGWGAGLILFLLFVAHLPFTAPAQRYIFTFIYLGFSGSLVLLYGTRWLRARSSRGG